MAGLTIAAPRRIHWPLPLIPHSPAVPPDTAIYETAKIAGRSKRAWPLALTPSFADFYFVALLVWLFVCGPNGWKALLMDGDTGWHIRTGEYILSQHAVPHYDLFSFSRPGTPWFAWEWLSDVLYASLFHMAGLKAVVLFAGVLVAAYATVILRYSIWRGCRRADRGLHHVAGGGRFFHALSGASAFVDAVPVAGRHLDGGGRPQKALAEDLDADPA